MKNRSSETYLVRPDRFFGNITPTRRPSMRVYEVNTITGENLSGLRSTTAKDQKEDDMEQALLAVQLLFYILGGLGLFFTGVGVLWFVTVYKEKKEQYRKLAA